MRNVLAVSLLLAITSQAAAEVPFKELDNGDLEVKIAKLTEGHIAELVRDIPGNQGKCVRFQILDFQEYGNDEALMRIPAERHGIEFELRGDGRVGVVCGRFGEETYDWNGNLQSSLDYE